MKTKNNIYFDINESEYITIINNIKFYFSSQLYKDKFDNLIHTYILSESIKLRNKYHVSCDLDLYLMISLYKKIEKRGYKVIDMVSGADIEEVGSLYVVNNC